tara:strand:- start:2443 stop:2754 length:312 start_codon:yes stop_codon:yes gene_type:complete
MEFKELANEQAVINLIGKNTAIRFTCAMDGVLHYKTVVPKQIREEFYDFEISVFYDHLEDFLDYLTVDALCFNRQIFEFKVLHAQMEQVEVLYHQKYIDPNNN